MTLYLRYDGHCFFTFFKAKEGESYYRINPNDEVYENVTWAMIMKAIDYSGNDYHLVKVSEGLCRRLLECMDKKF